MADDHLRARPVAGVVGVLRRLVGRGRDWLAARAQPRTYPTPPLTVEDGEGRRVDLRTYDGSAFESLVELYVDFDPARRAQGTPPVGEAAVRDWLRTVAEGPGVVAWHGDRAVGHVLFVPDGTGRHELAVFVHREYARAGIGRALIRAGLGHARATGVGYVWLSVGAREHGVQKLYSEVGFSTVNALGTAHRMSLIL